MPADLHRPRVRHQRHLRELGLRRRSGSCAVCSQVAADFVNRRSRHLGTFSGLAFSFPAQVRAKIQKDLCRKVERDVTSSGSQRVSPAWASFLSRGGLPTVLGCQAGDRQCKNSPCRGGLWAGGGSLLHIVWTCGPGLEGRCAGTCWLVGGPFPALLEVACGEAQAHRRRPQPALFPWEKLVT